MENISMIITVLEYPITAAVLSGVIPLIGYIIEKSVSFIASILAGIIGQRSLYFILHRVTFIGVVHHELAHALMAVITGAKLTKIVLFKPEGNRLGFVQYIPRGPKILQAVQCTLISIGPVVLGGLSLYCGYRYIVAYGRPVSLAATLFLSYIALSIFCHMTMSSQDYKVMWKGMPVVYLLVLLVVIICRISVFDFVSL